MEMREMYDKPRKKNQGKDVNEIAEKAIQEGGEMDK